MSVKCFVDTNILVYRRDSAKAEKRLKAEECLRHLWANNTGRISTQVLNEYYVTVTQKLKPGLSKELARSDIRALTVWQPLVMSAALIESAWEIQDRYEYSWWDTLIISSALLLDCAYLFSEDMQHEQNIGSLTIINPFLVEVDTL